MIRNYLHITFRNLLRQKGFSAINIAGLATGIAAFVLTMLFVQSELTHDRHHHEVDHVYRIELDAKVMEGVMLPVTDRSHFRPSLIGSWSLSPAHYEREWLNNTVYRNIRLEPEAGIVDVEAGLDGLTFKYVAPRLGHQDRSRPGTCPGTPMSVSNRQVEV